MKECCDASAVAVVDMESLSVYQALHQWRYQFFVIVHATVQIVQRLCSD